MNKKILAAFLCVCMVVVTGSFPVSAAKTKKTYKIAIDAGHQGKGNSKTEPIGPGAKMRKPKVAYGTQGVKTKVPESKLTLQIALKLEKELKKRGYDVYSPFFPNLCGIVWMFCQCFTGSKLIVPRFCAGFDHSTVQSR